MKFFDFIARAMAGAVKQIFRAVFYGVIDAAITLVIVAVWFLDNRPDLKVCHTANLDAEFT